MLYVRSWAPGDGREDRPKHVGWCSVDSRNCASGWFYCININKQFEDPCLGWSYFCAVLSELLYSSCSTAAIVASSLAGVCTICEWLALTSAVGVTLHVSWRPCYIHWNMLASGWHQLGECSAHFHTSLPDRLLQAPRVKVSLQQSWCVCCMIIQLPWCICLSWVQLETHLLSC